MNIMKKNNKIYPTENIKAITEFLFVQDDINKIKKSDLVLVLCNNNISGICYTIANMYERKIINNKTKVIISGNHGVLDKDEEKECLRVKEMLNKEYSYIKCDFVYEDKATNIYENLLFSKKRILDINKYNNIVIVAVPFSIRRIKLCASKLDFPLHKMQYIGVFDRDEKILDKYCWWDNEEAKNRVYGELERIGKYLIKGDLDIK